MKYVIWTLALVLFLPTMLPAQTAPPADVTIGPVRDTNLMGFSYLFVKRQVTRANAVEVARVEVPKMLGAVTAAHILRVGPVVMVYHNLPSDPKAAFDLEIGVMVKENSAAPAGYKVEQRPAVDCKDVLYSGAMQNLGKAYAKLTPKLLDGSAMPTGEVRIYLLYFEDVMSPNNVVLLAGVVQ